MKQENNYFWIGGKNTVIEVIKNKKREIKKILLNKNNSKTLPKNNIPFKISNTSEIDNIFDDKDFVHQGIAALVKNTQTFKDNHIKNIKKNENVIILDNIYDPRNIGSIIRSAVAFEIKYIILEKSVNINSHYLFKSASGATENIEFIKLSNLNNAIALLKKNNFYVYTSSLQAKKNLEDINFHTNNCIILGSESLGVKKLLLKNSDETFKIKQSKNIESLNVSNSAAIILNHLYQKKRA